VRDPPVPAPRVMPSASARSPTVLPSSRPPGSMSLSARDTVAVAPRQAGVRGAVSGRQRNSTLLRAVAAVWS
jgi:hypothetical protein